jgi:Uncharacterised nucleotidyltransferase
MPKLRLTGSFWPEGDERLALRAALLDGDEGAAAWERLRPRLDLDDPDPVLYPLLALLYRRLARGDDADPWLPKLRGIYRRTWYVNQLRRDRLKGVVEATALLEPIVFDGWDVVLRYYGDLGLRDVTALHLLVPPAHVRAAAEALGEAGWTSKPPFLDRRRPAAFESSGGDLCFLHSRAFPEFADPARGVESEDVWGESAELDFGGVPARTFGAADALLHVCLSGARPSAYRTMTWLADAVAVLRSGVRIDWDRFVRQARRLRGVLRATDALQFIRDELCEPVPDQVLEDLRRVPVAHREVLAHGVAARRWRVIGAPPETLTRFLRLTSDDGLASALVQLPTFLRDDLGLRRRAQVPYAAARLLAARLNQRAG